MTRWPLDKSHPWIGLKRTTGKNTQDFPMKYGGFHTWGHPQIIHFSNGFPFINHTLGILFGNFCRNSISDHFSAGIAEFKPPKSENFAEIPKRQKNFYTFGVLRYGACLEFPLKPVYWKKKRLSNTLLEPCVATQCGQKHRQ